MKHLPNLLTVANLFCGCIAIAFILSAQPFWGNLPDGQHLVSVTEQAYLGSLFIFIAAFCDLLDGLVARALKIFSPIGQDLDSLADVVSFGVAPSMILFKLLWAGYMQHPDAMDVDMLAICPAFLIACFAALRLAKYNITTASQKSYFIGMPTPAVGLFIAAFPLISWYNPFNLGIYMQNVTVIYVVIGVLCWLMVSRIKFFKFIPEKWSIAYTWPQLVLVIVPLATIPFLKIAALPLAFVLYIILSFVYKAPAAANTPATT